MIEKGLAKLFAHSFKTLGCTLSTPVDLLILSLFNLFSISLASNVGLMQSSVTISAIFGKLEVFSLTNTELKKTFKMFAISRPSVVILPSSFLTALI